MNYEDGESQPCKTKGMAERDRSIVVFDVGQRLYQRVKELGTPSSIDDRISLWRVIASIRTRWTDFLCRGLKLENFRQKRLCAFSLQQ